MRKEVTVVAAVAAAASVAAVAAHWHRRQRLLKETQRILRRFARDCATPASKLWRVADAFVADMEASLNGNGETASLNMLVSYVDSLPTGDEKGFYYGVNLRGSKFVIVCAKLDGKDEAVLGMHLEEISMPSAVMHGTLQELFNYIAVEVGKFVEFYPDRDGKTHTNQRKLGFMLSYPVHQHVFLFGSAITWDRISADDTAGKALVNDINRALEKKGVEMRVCAIVDDVVGDLAGGRYYSKDSVAAVNLGMATNAAYVEAAKAVSKWNGPSPKSDFVVMNTEWGNFNSPHLPRTEFYISLDAESSNPGERIYEKMIAGMYLGEIVRRVLLKMAQETALFGSVVPPNLTIPYLLRSPDIAAMHQDTSEDRQVINEKLKEIFRIKSSTLMAREVIAEVCGIVAERGARLAGAGIVAIIKKLGRMEKERSRVIVKGGLYEHYRNFRNSLHRSVWEMVGDEQAENVIVEHSHGRSGTGAVFLSASQNHHQLSPLAASINRNEPAPADSENQEPSATDDAPLADSDYQEPFDSRCSKFQITGDMGLPICFCGKCTCNINEKNQALQEKGHVYEFLMGLDDEYATVRSQILSKDLILEVGRAYSIAAQDEKQRRVMIRSVHGSDQV